MAFTDFDILCWRIATRARRLPYELLAIVANALERLMPAIILRHLPHARNRWAQKIREVRYSMRRQL